MLMNVEEIDCDGQITQIIIQLNESQLRGIEHACEIGRRWCEDGYAPGVQ